MTERWFEGLVKLPTDSAPRAWGKLVQGNGNTKIINPCICDDTIQALIVWAELGAILRIVVSQEAFERLMEGLYARGRLDLVQEGWRELEVEPV